jgi:hypothetical protein
MSPPNFRRLLEAYGDFSPMGVVWAFVGTSTAYEMFSGAMEVLGGLLLIFRRTALLGALVSIAVLVNVAMLNYCYDIPVKLYSTMLLLLAVYIAAPDAERLLDFFLRHRTPSASSAGPPPFRNRWMRFAALALKTAAIGYLFYSNVVPSYQQYLTRYGNVDRPPLYGIYNVETFSRSGAQSETQRWKKVLCERSGSVEVRLMNDQQISYPAHYDAARHIITLATPNQKSVLTYTLLDEGRAQLEGTLLGDPVAIGLQNSRLLSAGFHWVQEYPVNR